MLTVEKIGGTSMTAFADVLQNIIFHHRQGEELYNRIFRRLGLRRRHQLAAGKQENRRARRVPPHHAAPGFCRRPARGAG
ncbi:MAG: hypothetical protein WKG07_41095 [Hymenobacter sp.]